VAATSTSVSVNLFYSEDDNGSRIKLHELWIDNGDGLASITFNKVMTYDGIAQSHTLVKV